MQNLLTTHKSYAIVYLANRYAFFVSYIILCYIMEHYYQFQNMYNK
jgi:hypothetical protein